LTTAAGGYDAPFALQARIDWFRFECQHTKNALVHTAQRLAAHKALEGLDSQGELTLR